MDNLSDFTNALSVYPVVKALKLTVQGLFSNANPAENLAAASTSFVLIAAAEIGDKSQLVCMTLASKHRPAPVLLGAITAFAFLNSLAVLFGAALASWLPQYLIAALVAGLFALFGIHAFQAETDDASAEITEKPGHALFLTTFILITLAEFGDKTQLAVAALSSTALPLGVWLGATLALSFTSALGVLAGRTILQKIPLSLLHKLSGGIFLTLAAITGYHAYTNYVSLNGLTLPFSNIFGKHLTN